MKFVFCSRTDAGKVRKENQDSYGISVNRNLYIVCDGMGGGAAGDFASRTAVTVLLKSLELMKRQDVAAVLGNSAASIPEDLLPVVAAVRLANRALWNYTRKYHKLTGMGTTIVLAVFDDKRNIMHMFHVGDSRLYRFRNGMLEQLTKDHSKVNELLELGKMREDEIKTAEIQSMITRALGTNARVKIDYRAEYVRPEDIVVLCTDGLNSELEDPQISRVIAEKKESVEQIAQGLIDAANGAGGRDNTTVVAVKALNDELAEQLPYDSRHGNVVTVGEETEQELAAADRLLKTVIKAAKIEISKAAKEKSFSNPLYLGTAIALLLLGVSFIAPRLSKQESKIQFQNAKENAVKVGFEIRTPTDEEIGIFKKCDDTIQKLQMVQDWRRDKEKYTKPLKDVNLMLMLNGKEVFRGITGEIPVAVKIGRGNYELRLIYPNYKVMTDKIEFRDSITVAADAASEQKSVLVIMFPSRNQ